MLEQHHSPDGAFTTQRNNLSGLYFVDHGSSNDNPNNRKQHKKVVISCQSCRYKKLRGFGGASQTNKKELHATPSQRCGIFAFSRKAHYLCSHKKTITTTLTIKLRKGKNYEDYSFHNRNRHRSSIRIRS